MPGILYETACLRFGNQTAIVGDGPLACVLCDRVVLVQTQLEADVILRERCGKNCDHVIAPSGGFHRLVNLDKITPRMLGRPVGDWERDDYK